MYKFNFEQIKNVIGISRTAKGSRLILLFIALFGVFTSCQKEALKDTPAQVDLMPTDQQDFTVKDGYLNFKNWKTADSVLNKLQTMSQTEIDLWEINNGFKSARRSMNLAFAEYEKIQNENEFQKFKQKYNSEFVFSTDLNDRGFDYKNGIGFYDQIFSSSGKMIIGNILYDCTGRDLKVYLIKNGNVLENIDFNTGKKLKNYTVYPDNGLYTICEFPFYYNSSNNRRVRSYLEAFPKLEQAGIPPSPYFYVTYLYYLHQKGQKTVLGFWNDYNSNLNIKNGKIYIESEIYSKVQTGSIGSSSTKIAYVFLASYFLGGQLIGSGISLTIPSISFQGTTFSSGVPDNNAIDIIDYYGWGSYSQPWSDIKYVYGYGSL